MRLLRLGEVLDFGLVKTLGGDVPEAGLTAPHIVTPAYLSPESALGEAVDQQTAMQIVARHVSSEPALPSTHSSFNVSSQLDRLVLACLAKKPGDRPATARDLCDRLGLLRPPEEGPGNSLLRLGRGQPLEPRIIAQRGEGGVHPEPTRRQEVGHPE